MNTLKTLILCGALTTVGFLQANAATTLVRDVKVALSAVTQGTIDEESGNASVDRFRITTKDIINSIGQQSETAFSPKARLVLISDVTGEGNAGIFVIDGELQVDAGPYFSISTGESRVGSNKHSDKKNTDSGIDYFVFSLGFEAGTVSFQVQGVASEKFTRVTDENGNRSDSISATVSGEGTVDGDTMILSGTISTSAGKTQEVEDNPA